MKALCPYIYKYYTVLQYIMAVNDLLVQKGEGSICGAGALLFRCALGRAVFVGGGAYLWGALLEELQYVARILLHYHNSIWA